MPEVSKEAFEMPQAHDTATLPPDLATGQIQGDANKNVKNFFARLEGNAV